MISYGRQHITQEDIDAVIATLQSDYLTQGPKIGEFEKKFAEYIGAKYAVAVSNGTAALHLSALALGVNENSTVLTTPITFAASANCIRYCGGTVEFVDIDPATALMDLDKLYEKLKQAPKGKYSGVIPVDFAGFPVDLERLKSIAREFDLWIIEDACHAPGGYFTNSTGTKQFCGNSEYADLAIFSFHPVKHIATGEGGMITTNDEKLYQKLLLLRTHGISRDPALMHENHGGWYYEMLDLGYNYRLCDMQAALGITQLSRAEKGIERRRQIAARYDQAFENTAIRKIATPSGIGHAYHLYIIQVENRKGLYDHLRANEIFAQVHYIPVHLMPYYQQLGWKKGDLPEAEKYYEHCLSIPMYPSLTDEQQAYVIKTITDFYKC
jgi:UDP-4-amino-4,6-dideoxy-N-acetyl-beta-L-altrosamine transaminase